MSPPSSGCPLVGEGEASRSTPSRDGEKHAYSEASAMPTINSGSRNCSKGDNDRCEGGGSEVDRSYKRVPFGNASGENISADAKISN